MTGDARESTLVRLALLFVVAAVVLGPGRAGAAPPIPVDLIVVWTPGRPPPFAGLSSFRGAALLHRTPQPVSGAEVLHGLHRGIDRYEQLRFDDAWTELAEVLRLADVSGGVNLDAAKLSDLFLYRGLVQLQRGDPTAAWDELVTAMLVTPDRVLDPARFAPRVIEEIERARTAALARRRVQLIVTAPAPCQVHVDGVTAGSAPLEVAVGPHWIRAHCGAYLPWGGRFEVRDPVTRITVEPQLAEPPTDDEILIQARAMGARGVLIVLARGEVATLRVLGIDGRERERRTVALVPGVVAEPELTLAHMLDPRRPAARWYRSRWAWAAGAAVLAAAVVIPLTVAIVDDGGPPSITIRGPGTLP